MNALRPWALALLFAAGAGCSRTALNGDCPNGYARDTSDGGTGECVCSTNEGCPTGHACEEGVCVCRDTACCPTGYEYSGEAETCVCRDSRCCPRDHVWLENENRCVCGEQNCCPDGYVFSQDSQSCECAGDQCCPKGHAWDPMKKLCACASSDCCPVDFKFDPISKDCVCAKTECCPPNHEYDPNLAACVCIGDSCCPAGFRKGTDGRCVCINDASCGANRVCDMASGGCRCLNNAGCPADNFCNALGFCQSFASCTSNLDCPTGTFCDVTTTKCIPNGPCTLDEQCPMNQVCGTATLMCRPGCRDDGDCETRNQSASIKQACVNNACTPFCRSNDACPANQFCNKTTGTCAARGGRVDCQSCGNLPGECGSVTTNHCLTFVTEGQTASFCGMECTSDDDCPSGFDCGGVIFSCRTGLSCDAVPGETITCKAFQVENETGDQFYCSDSSGLPHVYFRACAPRSGFCPATAFP